MLLKQKLAINDTESKLQNYQSIRNRILQRCKYETRWRFCSAKEVETILEVTLNKFQFYQEILLTLTLDFTGQVPIQPPFWLK
jgi:hypothetical protein